jgi:hypothetical protein
MATPSANWLALKRVSAPVHMKFTQNSNPVLVTSMAVIYFPLDPLHFRGEDIQTKQAKKTR